LGVPDRGELARDILVPKGSAIFQGAKEVAQTTII
jgi:hypothetical protein